MNGSPRDEGEGVKRFRGRNKREGGRRGRKRIDCLNLRDA